MKLYYNFATRAYRSSETAPIGSWVEVPRKGLEHEKIKLENGVFADWDTDESEIEAAAYTQKKDEARRIILARYSESDQANLTQASVQILGLMLTEQRQPTPEEFKKLQEANTAKTFIDAVLLELHTNGSYSDFSKFM